LADLEKRDDLRQTFSVGDKRKYLYGEGRGELDMGLNAPQKKFHTKLWELPDESMNIEE
jgi:hypothetical protein